MKKIMMILASALSSILAFAASPASASTDSLTAVFFGDSYVYNHMRPQNETWHSKAALKLGMRYENRGKNGSAVAFDRTADGFGPRMIDRLPLLPDTADIIVIMAGHNDASKLESQGTIEDFKVEASRLVDALRSKYPEARLGWVLPYEVDRPFFPAIRGAIVELGESMDFPVLDIPASLINPEDAEFRTRYFQSPDDRAHLNAIGHDLLVDTGCEFLKKLSIENPVTDNSPNE